MNRKENNKKLWKYADKNDPGFGKLDEISIILIKSSKLVIEKGFCTEWFDGLGIL